VFLLVDGSGSLICWSLAGQQDPTWAAVAALQLVSATGQVGLDQTLHVYAVDNAEQLWVLHQDPVSPWYDDGSPHWCPPIALDAGIAAVAGALDTSAAPTLIAVDAAAGALRVHNQDQNSGMWRSGPVLTPGEQAYEVVRWRSEVSVVDGLGNLVPLQPMTVAVQAGGSACEVTVAGAPAVLTADTPTALTTDASGRLTFAGLAVAGLGVPGLVVTAESLTAPLTFNAAQDVHNYLSGVGTLNPSNPGGELPTFDAAGTTLAAAKVPADGTNPSVPLAPAAAGDSTLAATAAQAIQNAALVGLGTPAPGLAGFRVRLRGSHPSFVQLATRADLDAALADISSIGDGPELPGSLWSDIARWAGDVWEGIKNGVVHITDAVVDIVQKVATFTVRIGDQIAQGVTLAVHGLEQAGHFITGVFAAVEADLDKVLDWLKALFDFAAIWRTKMALQQGLATVPGWVKSVVGEAGRVSDNYFAGRKAEIHHWISQVQASLAGKTFGDLQSIQQPGTAPSSTSAAGTVSPSVVLQNVHHNWVHDKVATYSPSADTATVPAPLAGPWDDFTQQLQSAWGDLVTGITDLGQAMTSLLEQPSTFAAQGISDLLGTVGALVDVLLDLLDAMVDAFVGLTDVAMDALDDLLNQTLDLGPLSTLWQWMADTAGYPNDGTLTVSAVVALLAAFPVTLVYKLLEGVDNEPFPSGSVPLQQIRDAAGADSLAAFAAGMPRGCLVAAAVLQILYAVPTVASDILGPTAPGWLSVLSIAWSAVGYLLTTGLPSVEVIVAGGTTASRLSQFMTLLVRG